MNIPFTLQWKVCYLIMLRNDWDNSWLYRRHMDSHVHFRQILSIQVTVISNAVVLCLTFRSIICLPCAIYVLRVYSGVPYCRLLQAPHNRSCSVLHAYVTLNPAIAASEPWTTSDNIISFSVRLDERSTEESARYNQLCHPNFCRRRMDTTQEKTLATFTGYKP